MNKVHTGFLLKKKQQRMQHILSAETLGDAAVR
jgi:hypothetical protein